MRQGVSSVTVAHPKTLTQSSEARAVAPVAFRSRRKNAVSEEAAPPRSHDGDNERKAACGERRRRSRHLQVVFRRNPACDGQDERIRYEGYHMCWPDGGEVAIGFQRFCQQGSRLLGLGRRMNGKAEQLVELGIHPISGLEAPLNRMGSGVRFRRFYIERRGGIGRLHFFNGSPTDIVFDAVQDDPRVLNWIGLREIKDGETYWFDLSAETIADEEETVDYTSMAG